MVKNRALSPHLCTLLPPSTTSIIRALLQTVKGSKNVNTFSSFKIKFTVSMAATSLWNQEWKRSNGSRIAHTFFPTVHSDFTLPTLKPHWSLSRRARSLCPNGRAASTGGIGMNNSSIYHSCRIQRVSLLGHLFPGIERSPLERA